MKDCWILSSLSYRPKQVLLLATSAVPQQAVQKGKQNSKDDTKQMVILSEHSIWMEGWNFHSGCVGLRVMYSAPCRSSSLNAVVRYLFTPSWSTCQDRLPQYSEVHVHNWMPLSTALCLCTDIHTKGALNTFTAHTKRYRLSLQIVTVFLNPLPACIIHNRNIAHLEKWAGTGRAMKPFTGILAE